MAKSESELIRLFKQFMGPVTLLDYCGMDTTSAHRKLGSEAREQIQKILVRQLDALTKDDQFAGKIRRARQARAALDSKLNHPTLDKTTKTAVREYQACLTAWAEGAALAGFQHPCLAGGVDGLPVHPDDLATLLQEDEVGCQTGVYRESGGGVILWHSEEDHEEAPDQRFDRLRLFCFKGANGRKTWGFIYPDLLPGPTFGWQAGDSPAAGDFAQAVDTLHIRPIGNGNALLPNTLAWLSLYLGAQISCTTLAQQLEPFQGGYSITAVHKTGDRVVVEKVEFANGQTANTGLDESQGSYLFQTNIIRDLGLPIGVEEQTSPENRTWNEKRLARTEKLIRNSRHAGDPMTLISGILCSRLGGDSAYANRDVKATFVCRMAGDQTTIRVSPGAATPDGEYFSLEL